MAKITVLIPCYQHRQYLDGAIQGLFWQENGDWEAWIIGDGEKIANNWDDSRIKVFNVAHHGKVFQLNRFIDRVKTEYVAFNDADDISMPHRFSFCEGFDFVYGNAKTFSGSAHGSMQDFPVRESWRFNQIEKNNPCVFSTITLKTWLAKKEPFRDTWGGYGEDWLWLAHLSKKHRFSILKINKPLVYYRTDSGNFKAAGTKTLKRATLRWRIKRIGKSNG